MLGRDRAWMRVMPTDIEPYAQLYTPRPCKVKVPPMRDTIYSDALNCALSRTDSCV